MATPESIIIDTSAFYALISDSDEFHDSAVATYERLIDLDTELWTTSYALVETIALVHRRLGFQVLSRLLEFIESNVQVFWIESATHAMAMREFEASAGRGLSFVDWTIVLAARIKSAWAFTFDGGIADSGAAVIPLG